MIAVDMDKIRALKEMMQNTRSSVRGCCRKVSRDEVHALIDEIYDEYGIDS